MIIQACINGARPIDYHRDLPLTRDAMVRDAVACVASGAHELHIHPRDKDVRESLAEVDALVRAVREHCPGTLMGVSTGAWIEADPTATRTQISQWSARPDYASVNLSEADAPAVIALLAKRGVGVEAGLATTEDAIRFAGLPERDRVFRILIEIDEQQLVEANAVLDGIVDVLRHAGIARPVLLHGFDATVWHFVRRAWDRRWSTRVGLEDGCLRENGSVASSNAELVADASAIFRGRRA